MYERGGGRGLNLTHFRRASLRSGPPELPRSNRTEFSQTHKHISIAHLARTYIPEERNLATIKYSWEFPGGDKRTILGTGRGYRHALYFVPAENRQLNSLKGELSFG